MRHSFTLRLTLRFAVLVILTTALVLAAGGWLLHRQAMTGLADLHAVEGGELGQILGDQPLAAVQVAERIVGEADSDAALFFIQVRDGQGNIVFRSANLGATLLPALNGQERNWETEIPAAGRVLLSDFQEVPWLIQVASRLDPTDRMMRGYARVSAVLLIGVTLLSVVLGHQFSRTTLQPVRAIESTARRIRADNLSERIPVAAGHGELTALINLLNDTFDRLQLSFEQVQRFTADASHELKTPLALARLNAEKLQARVRSDPEAEAMVAEVLGEIARLNRIIENLLFLAKTEGGALRLVRREIPLAALVREFADDALVLAEVSEVDFVLARNDEGTVEGDAGLLRQLFLNLLSNALAVTPRGGKVTLESGREPGGWRLVLSDEGPGLPADQLERIFGRFVRFDGSPRKDTPGGAGLGLAICRGIVELHGGRIFAENRSDRTGLRLQVCLPAATGR
jgi:two-component system heavy metal sensor histidine kinase CusS